MTTLCVSFGAFSCADSNEDVGGAGGLGAVSTTSGPTATSGSSVSSQVASSSSATGASVSSVSTTASASTAVSSGMQSSSSTGLMMLAGFEPETEPNDTLMTGNLHDDASSGFVAQLVTGNDIDVFTFEGTMGDSMHIEVTDGMGGCPIVGTNLQVQLFNPAGQEIASRFAACPRLDQDLDVANLASTGTYQIRVSGLAPVPWYALEIGVIPVACGNGVRQQGESCDDGNVVSGDGCDAVCQVELPGGACSEVEPNDVVGDATGLVGCEWGVGVSATDADLDFYSFDVPADGYSVRIQVNDITGVGCPGGVYGGLRLFNPANVQIESADTFSAGQCPSIVPMADPGAVNLPTGKYKVSFDPGFNVLDNTAYAIHVTMAPPGCGDSLVQAGEDCDDGNQDDTDFCDNACHFGAGVCGEVEPNDSVLTANNVDGCDIVVGAITLAGSTAEGDYFSFTVAANGSSVRAETLAPDGIGCPSGVDNVLRLYDPNGVQLGEDDQDGIDSCALIDPFLDPWAANLPAGTYTVRMEDWLNNAAIPAYGVVITVTPPGCGDGFLQAGEECEDGNVVNGDGCSDACIIEGTFCVEAEPNNTQATATPVTNACTGRGSITPANDVDRYSFQVTQANSTVVIETSDGLGGCPQFDSFIRLYDPANVQLAQDDDSGVDICSKLTRANLPVGTYTFSVEETGQNATQALYFVEATVTP